MKQVRAACPASSPRLRSPIAESPMSRSAILSCTRALWQRAVTGGPDKPVLSQIEGDNSGYIRSFPALVEAVAADVRSEAPYPGFPSAQDQTGYVGCRWVGTRSYGGHGSAFPKSARARVVKRAISS